MEVRPRLRCLLTLASNFGVRRYDGWVVDFFIGVCLLIELEFVIIFLTRLIEILCVCAIDSIGLPMWNIRLTAVSMLVIVCWVVVNSVDAALELLGFA